MGWDLCFCMGKAFWVGECMFQWELPIPSHPIGQFRARKLGRLLEAHECKTSSVRFPFQI